MADGDGIEKVATTADSGKAIEDIELKEQKYESISAIDTMESELKQSSNQKTNTKSKNSTKIKVSTKKNATVCVYPTRYQAIGETDCLFFSWYRKGKVPLCTLGPSKCPMLILLAMAAGITAILSTIVLQYKDKSFMISVVFACLIFVNLTLFFMTLCGEMGVPTSVYERYYKLKYLDQSKKEESEDLSSSEQQAISSESDIDDLESFDSTKANISLQNRKSG